ncbi:MAG: glycoside hydrolase family 13 protein, partial [Oscillospiraceae bacterium]|nr:glycoside hydrolase family 13 protein [Oscillospiraceae bacterium]
MSIHHNSHDLIYRSPFGAAEIGSEVSLFIEADGINKCDLLLWPGDGEMRRLAMTPCEGGFRLTLDMPAKPQLLWYCFALDEIYYGNTERGLGGAGKVYDHMPPCYQITVYKPSATPEWYKNAVVYQIFPDRFNRGSDWLERQQDAVKARGKNSVKRMLHEEWDDTPFYPRDDSGNVTRWTFFGGTLEGIREKLDYLAELGVTAIYLNPIFKAASNHKYDTCDYMMIDEGFGDEESFRRLAKDAEAKGISLILDGVFSHTGADSVYFDKYHNYSGGACEGETSKYYSWYRFRSFPDDYECWWGVADLPNVEENDPSYREFICRGENSVIRKWLRLGARGWRLDVADELPDSFIKDIRLAMDVTKPDSVLLGEVWEDASNKISYGERREYLFGEELHSTMNYPFRAAAIEYILGSLSAEELGSIMMSLRENYPRENFYGALNLIGSHDRARTLTVLGNAPGDLSNEDKGRFRLSGEMRSLAVKRMKLLSLLQFTAP